VSSPEVVRRKYCGAASSPPEHALRVLDAHLLDGIGQDRSRLLHRHLRGAVHADDELVGLLAHADHPQPALDTLDGVGQRNLYLRVAEETVGRPELAHRALPEP
jgi:hypothetical protein